MLKFIVHRLMLMIHAKTSKAWHALNFAIVEASAGWGPSDRVKELPSLAVKHLEFLEALIHVLPNSSTTLGSWIDHKMYGKNMLSWERASAFWFTAVCISRDSSFSIQCVAWALACISCYPGIQRQVYGTKVTSQEYLEWQSQMHRSVQNMIEQKW